MDSIPLADVIKIAEKYNLEITQEEAMFLYGFVEQQAKAGLQEIRKQIENLETDESVYQD